MAVIVVVVLRLTGIELTEIGVGLALTDIIGQPDTELAAKNQPGADIFIFSLSLKIGLIVLRRHRFQDVFELLDISLVLAAAHPGEQGSHKFVNARRLEVGDKRELGAAVDSHEAIATASQERAAEELPIDTFARVVRYYPVFGFRVARASVSNGTNADGLA